MFIDQLEPADRRNISLLLDGVMSNRDPRIKAVRPGLGQKNSENLKPIWTDRFMDRAVRGFLMSRVMGQRFLPRAYFHFS